MSAEPRITFYSRVGCHLCDDARAVVARVCADLVEWTVAEVHFLRGVEIAKRIGDLGMLAGLLTNRAEPLIRTGEFEAARMSLDWAEPLASDLGDSGTLAEIALYRGMASRLEVARASAARARRGWCCARRSASSRAWERSATAPA